jgi:predicted DNA-binding transcriptional regulator YafY
MSDKSEKLAFRLGDILTRLFMGEVLCPESLVDEYQVSEKTLRRDFNERLINAPIVRADEGYKLDPATRSNGNGNKLLQDMGLASLLPVGYLSNAQSTVLFKNPRSESPEQFDGAFRQLIDAIIHQSVIDLTHDGKINEHVHPYRLVNDRGIWYLAATHSGQLYSYRLAKISQIHRREDKYKPNRKVHEEIHRQGMEWLTSDNADVLVQVDREIASHFLDAVVLPNQQLLKELSDGSLLISSRVSRLSDILPLLKAWMPQLEVLSPVSLKLELIRELYASLDRCKL